MKKIGILISIILLVTGCIKNDIPYPVIKGEVLKFEVEGQLSATIDEQNRVINVVLSENVNPANVKVKVFQITADATSTLDKNNTIDLTKKQTFVITTYQDWSWEIVTTQPTARKIVVEGQVGEARFDLEKKEAFVGVTASKSLKNITVKEFKVAPSGAIYTPDPLTVKDFTNPVIIEATYWGKTEQWRVIIERKNVNVTTLAADPWGNFAYLVGEVATGSTLKASFEYRQADETKWTSVEATVDQAKITAKAIGLKSQTRYVYRAKLGDEEANEIEFTTEATPLIPNMGLNDWLLVGKNWFPNADGETGFWASGNPGATGLGGAAASNTSPTDDAVAGKAAKLESISVAVVGMAAGNLFTGSFKTNIMKPLDSPSFNQPYTGRPTKFSFWYKYAPKPLDSKQTPSNLKGQMDKCSIYIILGTWDDKIKSSQIKGLDTPGAIAYGVFETDATVSQYTRETIKLEYKDLVTKPTRIMIVASSSKLGEQYTGGLGSTLLIDELEFSFD